MPGPISRTPLQRPPATAREVGYSVAVNGGVNGGNQSMSPKAPPGASATHNETLFELAQWLARVQQYSASHPACAQLGERTHAALMRSFAIQSPLVIDVPKPRWI